ncbi:DUF4197 domain-containing protein [Thiolapillus sp.]
MNMLKTMAIASLLAVAGGSWAGFGEMLKDSASQFLKGENAASAASSLSQGQIGAGLKEALSVGAERAVAYLGKPGGFLSDPKVRIPLPSAVDKVASRLRMAGQGALVDEFETTMNKAAEAAIPKTLDIVKDTVQNMTLDDAGKILNGGDDAATRYLREKAGPFLEDAIRPIVSQATDKVGATASYKQLTASAGGGMLGGLLGGDSLDLDNYVTEKTLDGLFYKLAQEEKLIRQNPVARSTDLLKQVFGK